MAFAAHQAHRLQQQQVFGRRLPSHRDHLGDLCRRTRPAVAQSGDDAQPIGISERIEHRGLGDGGRERAHTFSLSTRYLRTSSVCLAQPSLLPSNAAARRSAGICSNPDSTMRSSTPSSVSVRVNSTNVVGSCDPSPVSTGYGCQRNANRRCGSIATMCQLSVLPTCGCCIRATSSSTVVGVITPVTDAPSTNGPSKRTPNHWPNCSASLIALHTRSSGARRTTSFSIRSLLMCNLLVAYHHSRGAARRATVWLREWVPRSRPGPRRTHRPPSAR